MEKIISTFLLIAISFTGFSQQAMVDKDIYYPIEIDPQEELAQIHSRNALILVLNDGRQLDLTIRENNTLSAEVKRDFKNILTYDLLKNGVFVGTYTWSEFGVWYHIILNGEMISVYPNFESSSNEHIIEYGVNHKEPSLCNYEEVMLEKKTNPELFRKMKEDAKAVSRTSFGEDVREYRLAFVTTGEFYQLNGNAPGPVSATITATVNGLTALYLNELSVRFVLSRQRIYSDPNNDPFIPALGNRTQQAADAVAANFGAPLYDIGHALHRSETGDGWDSGGVARLNSVCREDGPTGPQPKASGWSGSFNTNGFSWISLIGHEFGHMFGAEHTFNGIGSSCTDAISETTAYEIGSGTTIMSYNGICDADQNIPASGASDNYFHVNSLMQMRDHILGIGDCASKVASNNGAPVVITNPCGATFTVPKLTPFYIEGMATDPDGHDLTYCWEQFDEDGTGTPTQGFIGTQASARVNSPLFRSFPPTDVPYRFFPRESTVLAGNNTDPFDVLPALGRTVNLKLTVRDNQPEGGSFTIEDLPVTVSNSGPLSVNNQSTWSTGDVVNVGWTSIGTESLCDKVDVLLSIDGGNTYPYILGDDVSYAAGTLPVTVSGLFPSTSTARIKVKCDDFECFYFYDINNTNFRIVSECAAPTTFLCPAEDQTFDAGNPGLNMTNLSKIVGTNPSSVTKTISFANSDDVDVITFDTDGSTCKKVRDDYVAEYYYFQVDKTGSYTFNIDPNEDGYGFITLFTDANFSPTNACPSFVASSGVWGGNGTSVGARSFLTANLNACTKYRMVFYNYSPTANTRITSMSGPGYVIEEELSPDPNFTTGYVVVSKNDNVIRFITSSPDFTSMQGGEYTVYAVSFKSGGPTPPNITNIGAYVGQQFNSFYVDGDCLLNSTNSFDLTINGSCSINDVQLGTTGSCNPMDNNFTQELIIIYDVAPSSGDISVNGQTFPITTSPQAIVVNLPSTGEMLTSEVFFTDEPLCKIPFTVVAPENCCPFDLDLGDTLVVCAGESIDLDAGDGGMDGSYQWYDPSDNLLAETGSTLNVSTAGLYRVIVSNSTGCEVEDRVLIEVLPVPTLNVSDDVTICDGENTTLSCTTTGNTIRWSFNGEVLKEGVSSSLVVNTGGTYIVEAYFTDVCVTTKEIVVTANESPEPDLGGDVFLCEGEMETLDGTANGVTYVWYKDNVVQPETGTMFTIDETSTIKVEVTNVGECTGTDEVNVLVEGIPTLSVSDDVTICDGEETTLMATTQASLVKWYVDDVLVQSGPNTSYLINTGGSIRVEAGNSENCSVEEIITVTANESPKPNLGFDKNLCEGEDVRLSGNVEGETYVWYKDGVELMESDSFIIVNETATYTLEVTNIGECTGTDEIDVEIFALPTVEAGNDVIFCEGDDVVIDASSSSDIFFWYKDGDPYSAIDLMFNTDEPGMYVLEAQNNAGCAVFDTLTITQNQKPIVELGDDRLACIGDEVTLSGPSGDYNYEWFVGGVSVSQDEEISVTDNSLVVLIVSDMNDCSAEDNVTITFEPGPTLSINESSVMLCEGESFMASLTTNSNSIEWYKDGILIPGATMTELSIDEEGTYVAQASGAGGCLVSEEVVVTINPLPNVDLPSETIECEGSTITLMSNVMGDQYSWTFNGSEISDMSSVNVDQEGVYTLEVTNEFDCKSSDQTTVMLVSLPTIDDLETSATFCEGQSLDLMANSNGLTFQWFLDGNPINGETSKAINISEEGTYTFEASGQGNCALSQDVNVVEVKSPDVDLGGDVILCPGEMVSLDAGANTGGSYEWSNNETTRIIDLSNDNVTTKEESTLTVTVTNSFDCATSQSINVTLLPIIVASISSTNDGVCTGDSLVLSASGGEVYTWNGPAQSFEIIDDNSILVYPSEASDFSVVVSDQCPNNEDTDTIRLNVYVPQDASAGNDTCALKGRTIELNASGGVSYVWESHPSIEGSLNSSSPEIAPTEETTYTVTITDSNGCVQEDQVTICIIDDPLSIFKAPTALTPNDDGFNDRLEFPGLEAFAENKLIIYNRWGNIVYEKSNYQQDDFLFDGTRNGEELPADTYYYILIFDEFKIKETLTILRSN